MTREEAIKVLNGILHLNYRNFWDEECDEAIDMAIEALSAPQTDLISRADAIKAVVAKVKWFDGDAIEDRCKRDAFMQVLDEILTELPSAEAVQGEWIDKGEYAKCSICGAHSGTQFDGVEPIPLKSNFCPNCGARMKGGAE